MSLYADRVAAPPTRSAPRRPAEPQARPARQGSPLAHLLQLRAAQSARAEAAAAGRDGLPAGLKAGIEHLSGIAMDDVRVHHNSSEPAKLGALAFAQGADIHLGPGQERHLPHEAWHVVQQKQGRVDATRALAFGGINDDPDLEREATQSGARADRLGASDIPSGKALRHVPAPRGTLSQLKPDDINKDYDLPLGPDGKYAGEKGKRRGKQAGPLNRLAKTDRAIKVPGDEFIGGHLLRAEYGGKDVTSNVVPWVPAMEIAYSAFEEQMPARMLARAQAWGQDQRPVAQRPKLTIRFHAEARFVDWARNDVDIETPARSDAEINRILKTLSRIPVSVATSMDGQQLAGAWAIADMTGGKIKITREPPIVAVPPAGAPAAAPAAAPAPAPDPPSWQEEHISPD